MFEEGNVFHFFFSIALPKKEEGRRNLFSFAQFRPPSRSLSSLPLDVRLLRPGSRGAPAGQRGGALGTDRSGSQLLPPRIREREWRPRRSRRHVRGRHPPQARPVAQRDRDRDGEPDVVRVEGENGVLKSAEEKSRRKSKASISPIVRFSPPSPLLDPLLKKTNKLGSGSSTAATTTETPCSSATRRTLSTTTTTEKEKKATTRSTRRGEDRGRDRAFYSFFFFTVNF